LQAAVPAFEISRLLTLLGFGIKTLQAFGVVFLVVSACGVFAALFKGLRERRYDLAVMRVQGASRLKIFSLILSEGLLIGVTGVIIGIALGHGVAYVLSTSLGATITGAGISFVDAELWVMFGVVSLSIIASIIPAIMAYRTDIAKVLVHEG
jgi:putative ABC transport system permease protein